MGILFKICFFKGPLIYKNNPTVVRTLFGRSEMVLNIDFRDIEANYTYILFFIHNHSEQLLCKTSQKIDMQLNSPMQMRPDRLQHYQIMI